MSGPVEGSASMNQGLEEHRLAQRVVSLEPSLIREMTKRAAEMNEVISLGIGEPDFHTPQEVVRKALGDALEGATHYTPSRGDPELLGALLQWIRDRWGHSLGIQNLVITVGGMGALTAFFRTVLNPEDEVLIPEPHFPAYRPHVEWAGGRVVHVPTRFEEGFVVQPEEVERALSPKSKVLMLNSPNNPTGAVIPPETLDALAELARDHDLLVLSDEVYDRLVYDGQRHDSISTRREMLERTVVVGSFSKGFAMTGWRLGFAFGPSWLMDQLLKVITYETSCAPSVSQRAAYHALRQDPMVFQRMVQEFQRRRDLVYDALHRMEGVRVHRPRGAFYIFPDLSHIAPRWESLALRLLEEERVVVVPGSAFGPSGAGCVRIAYTVDLPALKEAMLRIHRFLERIRKEGRVGV